MRNSSKSFAHQYGISQKNITTNPSMGIGLNPNLNIEDEYIQNLLKQTHFLNMEIKLIKQKQKENKGMGIMGLLNKDQNPVVSHAISSNNKYSQMKNKLSTLVNTAQVQYLKLDDQNFAVKAQRDFAQRVSLKQEQKNIKHKLYVDKQMIQNNDSLRESEKRLMQMRQENNRMRDNHERVSKDWQEITTKETSKKLYRDINSNLENEFEELRQRHFQIKYQILIKNQKRLQEQDEANRQDPNYISLVQENEELTEKVKATEKELFDKNYKVKQMQELKKLAMRNKDYEAEAKKQAADQAEKLKKKLTDKKGQFDAKLKQAKSGLQTNDQIRLLKGKIARKDKETTDIRKKTEMSEKNFKSLRDQVDKLSSRQAHLRSLNDTHQKQFIHLNTTRNESISELNKDQLDNQKLQLDLNGTSDNLNQTRKRLQDLQEEVTYLKAKQDFLNKQVNVDEGMKTVKIEQLTSLMHNNSGLNDTIKDLMVKWDQMRKFSREMPTM